MVELPENLENRFPQDFEFKSGNWSIAIRFHPTLHAIIRGPPKKNRNRIPRRILVRRKPVNDKPIVLSTYEILQICQDEQKIRAYTKIPKYLQQDLLRALHFALRKAQDP